MSLNDFDNAAVHNPEHDIRPSAEAARIAGEMREYVGSRPPGVDRILTPGIVRDWASRVEALADGGAVQIDPDCETCKKPEQWETLHAQIWGLVQQRRTNAVDGQNALDAANKRIRVLVEQRDAYARTCKRLRKERKEIETAIWHLDRWIQAGWQHVVLERKP